MTIIGIDPGQTGAIAVILPSSEVMLIEMGIK